MLIFSFPQVITYRWFSPTTEDCCRIWALVYANKLPGMYIQINFIHDWTLFSHGYLQFSCLHWFCDWDWLKCIRLILIDIFKEKFCDIQKCFINNTLISLSNFCLSHVVAAADVFLSANPQWRHLPRFFFGTRSDHVWTGGWTSSLLRTQGHHAVLMTSN